MTVMSAFRNFLPAVLIGRLAPDVTPAQAAERVEAAYRRLTSASADSAPGRAPQPRIVPLQRSLVGDRRTTLFVLMGSAGLLLVIACANAATLLLARAAVRRREIATHAVLGASRRRLVARLLVESVMLAAGGALAGLSLAAASVSLLSALLPPSLAGLAPMQVDLRVLSFAIAVSALTGIGFGLWPALGGSRVELRTALQDAGGRTVTRGGVNRSLVVVQVALACVLTVGAALMIGSLRSLLATDVGMRIEEVAAARMNLPPAAYSDSAAVPRFVRSAVEGLAGSPGVAAAAAVNTLPLAREAYVAFRLDHEGATDRHTSEARHSSPYLVVSPGYFRTMGIPLLRGRDLSWTDSASFPVAVVNLTMAQRFWPGEDPIGKRFLMTDLRTVVGVVADAQITELGTEIGPQVYLPIQDQPQTYLSLVARRTDDATLAAVTDRIRTAVHRVDPELPLYAAQPMTAVVAEALAPRRLNTLLLSLFGAAAVTLAAIGVYGLLACAVAQRTREIGVRVALGAERRQVLALVVRQGTTLVAVGVGIGMATAAGAARYLQGMLYGVGARDPVTFVSVAIALGVVGLIASAVPARRAAATDPLEALRAE
jgi:predicted permease